MFQPPAISAEYLNGQQASWIIPLAKILVSVSDLIWQFGCYSIKPGVGVALWGARSVRNSSAPINEVSGWSLTKGDFCRIDPFFGKIIRIQLAGIHGSAARKTAGPVTVSRGIRVKTENFEVNREQERTFCKCGWRHSLGEQIPCHRLGFGAMRLTGEGIWGPPKGFAKER